MDDLSRRVWDELAPLLEHGALRVDTEAFVAAAIAAALDGASNKIGGNQWTVHKFATMIDRYRRQASAGDDFC